jgi:hypothetical protein
MKFGIRSFFLKLILLVAYFTQGGLFALLLCRPLFFAQPEASVTNMISIR